MLAGELGLAICAERIGRVIWQVRASFRAVEDKVRRDVDEPDAASGRSPREKVRPLAVHGLRPFALALGSVHGGVSRGVDNDGRLMARKSALDLRGICYIEQRARQCNQLVHFRYCSLQLAPQLPTRAGHEHLHGKHSAFLSKAPATSFAASVGVLPSTSGHSIPIAGSFHNTTRSSSGA